MHIDLLSIPLLPVNNRCYEYQCIPGNEVPYASFPACVCCKIKFECPGEGQEGKREEGVEERSGRHYLAPIRTESSCEICLKYQYQEVKFSGGAGSVGR